MKIQHEFMSAYNLPSDPDECGVWLGPWDDRGGRCSRSAEAHISQAVKRDPEAEAWASPEAKRAREQAVIDAARVMVHGGRPVMLDDFNALVDAVRALDSEDLRPKSSDLPVDDGSGRA